MQPRSLTRLRVSLALSFAFLAFPSAASAIVAAPYAHRWYFDEEDGAVAYDEAGVFDGTLGDHATRTAGPFGSNVLTIVPTSTTDYRGYVDFGKSVAFGTADFTISHWYKTTFSGSGLRGEILGNRMKDAKGNFISVYLGGDGRVTVELCEDPYGKNYVSLVSDPSLPVNDGQWHHLAYVREGGMVSLYIDGQFAAWSNTGGWEPTNLDGLQSFRIGRRLPAFYTDFHTIPASYEDLRIFDRALTDTEVLDVVDGVL
ncbi:LamG domain-containing protein [Polyangium jinanense]|uniref:LamG domain-containing protein n=1 Tax=Polyangium jinanense TaxID=2829994 RepID=A0A9X3XC77_9BACT|nr:LamG domain-containing protein [Polyangium jinanense]MDC3958788.1 LamG domain-containing protein [Polyangium jinanense]MDC3985231.1 LamG domain-containing protein [Polyangium jinanense]